MTKFTTIPVAHVRLVPPEDYRKGELRLNVPTHVFVTLPGQAEARLPKTTDIEIHWGEPGGSTSVTVTFNATVQIDEGSTPVLAEEQTA